MDPAPGSGPLLRLAAKALPPGARVLDVASAAAPALPGREVTSLPAADVLARLAALPAPVDGLVALQPTRLGALIPLLRAFHDAIGPDGRVVVSDLVWQTAPTPDLVRAFSSTPGLEKVRPIEGYEMQLDHAGFTVVERLDLPRADWLPHYGGDPARREALAGDSRGAAKVAGWVLARGNGE